MHFDSFFDEANARSMVKARLVARYFGVWSAAMLMSRATQAIAYVEFCAGPGRYGDGTESTPLLVLRQALDWPLLADSLVTVFNDIEPDHVATLRREIGDLPGGERLRYRPLLLNQELDARLVDQLSELITGVRLAKLVHSVTSIGVEFWSTPAVSGGGAVVPSQGTTAPPEEGDAAGGRLSTDPTGLLPRRPQHARHRPTLRPWPRHHSQGPRQP